MTRTQIDLAFASIDFASLERSLKRVGKQSVLLGAWPLGARTVSLVARTGAPVSLEFDAKAIDWTHAPHGLAKWHLEWFELRRSLPFGIELDAFEPFARALSNALGVELNVPAQHVAHDDGREVRVAHGEVKAHVRSVSGDEFHDLVGSFRAQGVWLSFEASGYRAPLNVCEVVCARAEATRVRAALAAAIDAVDPRTRFMGELCAPDSWLERAEKASMGATFTQREAATALQCGVIDAEGFAVTTKRVPLGFFPECLEVRVFELNRIAGERRVPVTLETLAPVLFGQALPAAVAERKSQLYGSKELGRRYELGDWLLQERVDPQVDRSDPKPRVELQIQQQRRGPWALFIQLDTKPNGFCNGLVSLVGEKAVVLEVQQTLERFFATTGHFLRWLEKRVALGVR